MPWVLQRGLQTTEPAVQGPAAAAQANQEIKRNPEENPERKYRKGKVT